MFALWLQKLFMTPCQFSISVLAYNSAQLGEFAEAASQRLANRQPAPRRDAEAV